MSENCIQEPLIRRAAVEDRWTDALRQHVASCRDCAAAAAAAPFMTQFARIDARQRALPDPAVLWLKAQILRGSAVAERVSRPLNIAQMVSYVVIAAGWAGLLTWKWKELQQVVLRFTPASIVNEAAGVHSSMSATIALGVLVLCSLTVMLGLHAILAEE
jgi:hypothetical protein